MGIWSNLISSYREVRNELNSITITGYVQTLSANGDGTTFDVVLELAQAVSIVDELDDYSAGPFTVFVPSDEDFASAILCVCIFSQLPKHIEYFHRISVRIALSVELH